jgi:hypothetical protein
MKASTISSSYTRLAGAAPSTIAQKAQSIGLVCRFIVHLDCVAAPGTSVLHELQVSRQPGRVTRAKSAREPTRSDKDRDR